MSVTRLVVLSLSLLPAPVALAHGDHGHGHGHGQKSKAPVTEDVLRKRAPKAIAKLIDQGKLGPTWKDAALKSIELKAIKEEKVWLVSFENPHEPDATKRSFFLFFTTAGELVAANFTGK